MPGIIRQVAEDTGHINISGKLAGFLVSMAGHDFIAIVLIGVDKCGLGNVIVLDTGHRSPYFFIILDLKEMIFKEVESVQLDIYDLFLDTVAHLL